jgi:hypothetical protein
MGKDWEDDVTIRVRIGRMTSSYVENDHAVWVGIGRMTAPEG